MVWDRHTQLNPLQAKRFPRERMRLELFLHKGNTTSIDLVVDQIDVVVRQLTQVRVELVDYNRTAYDRLKEYQRKVTLIQRLLRDLEEDERIVPADDTVVPLSRAEERATVNRWLKEAKKLDEKS